MYQPRQPVSGREREAGYNVIIGGRGGIIIYSALQRPCQRRDALLHDSLGFVQHIIILLHPLLTWAPGVTSGWLEDGVHEDDAEATFSDVI